MSEDKNRGKYWPYMILGFLSIGVTLGYWTIKSTISLPVHESNAFMQKYQSADKDAYQIEESEAKFDSKYNVSVSGLEPTKFKPKHLKRKPHNYYLLKDENSITYQVSKKDGSSVANAKITLLVTRPQTQLDDFYIKEFKQSGGSYKATGIKIQKPGRYILRAKIQVGDDVKYLDVYAIKPDKH